MSQIKLSRSEELQKLVQNEDVCLLKQMVLVLYSDTEEQHRFSRLVAFGLEQLGLGGGAHVRCSAV
jgi:hypothetical protein